MTPTLPPIGRPTIKVSDCVERSTLLVSKCNGVPTLSELKFDDTTISQKLLSIGRPTLQGLYDVEFPTVYTILVGTSEGIMVEYVHNGLSELRPLLVVGHRYNVTPPTAKKRCMCRIPDRLVSNFRHGSRQILTSNSVVFRVSMHFF